MSARPLMIFLLASLASLTASAQAPLCSAVLANAPSKPGFGRIKLRAAEAMARAEAQNGALAPSDRKRVILGRSMLDGKSYAFYLPKDQSEKTLFMPLTRDTTEARWLAIDAAAEDILFLENGRLLRITKRFDPLAQREVTTAGPSGERFRPETLNAELKIHLASLPESYEAALRAHLPRLKQEILRGRLRPTDLSSRNIISGVSSLDGQKYLIIMAHGDFSLGRDNSVGPYFAKAEDFLIPLTDVGPGVLREIGDSSQPEEFRLDYHLKNSPTAYVIK